MNILIVNYEYPPIGAGAARQNYYLAKELVAAGNKVVELTANYGNTISPIEENNVIVERIWAIRRHKNQSNMIEMLSFVLSALFKINRIIKKYQIDKLIIFFSIPCGPIGLWAKWISKTEYIISLRGGDVPGYDVNLNSFHKILKPLRQLIYKNSKAVVANSEGLAKLAQNADNYSVGIIENGVDSDFFRPLNINKQSTKFRFLFVGRLHAIKNISLLLNWVSNLSKTKTDFELYIYGQGPEEETIKQFIVEYKLEEFIQLFPWVSVEELPEIYNSANCFVNPSFNEGLPNTVMEAMSCGLPVIVSNVVGNRDLVEHKQNGLIFESDNLEDFTKQANIILTNNELAKQIAQKNRELVLEKYSTKVLAEKYYKLL